MSRYRLRIALLSLGAVLGYGSAAAHFFYGYHHHHHHHRHHAHCDGEAW